jgi:hypothetical protein
VLKKWPKPWLSCANGILETKANDGSTAAKAPAPRTNPNTKEAPTAPKPHTHPLGHDFFFFYLENAEEPTGYKGEDGLVSLLLERGSCGSNGAWHDSHSSFANN